MNAKTSSMNVLKALYMKAFHGKCATDFLKAGFRDATTIYGFMGFLGEGSTLIGESWKKSKTRDRHRARLPGNKSRAKHCINLYMFWCFGCIFQKSR